MSDIYIIVHLATTCDDSTTYVTKDSSELIEFAWETLDTSTLETLSKDSILVRPINTPITPYCSRLHKISWEHVKNAGSFKDAIAKFDQYVQDEIIGKKQEFSIVMYDTSKLRVQLSREARDKSVVLPSYLQHPRVFDIPKEYCNWQSTHAEALSYPATSLSNIITALGLEIENISEYNELPNFSSSTPPPRASVDDSNSQGLDSGPNGKTVAELYAMIVKQLVKKSMPIEEHPTVFTKPYDSGQDITVFSAERSKVLYLSNLPNDTTQSELESWFTQYGGRPGGFWTFKNGEDSNNGNNGAGKLTQSSKAGIAGFVAFGTHDEAADCLALNGRVLGDRAIEVQPSSSKVFDIAMDKLLLTSFPLSKNKPRPGDWTCLSCGFSNFQRRTHCFRCSFSAVAFQDLYNHSNNSNSSNLGRRTSNQNTPIGNQQQQQQQQSQQPQQQQQQQQQQQHAQPQSSQLQQQSQLADKMTSGAANLSYNGLNDGSSGLQNYSNDSNVGGINTNHHNNNNNNNNNSINTNNNTNNNNNLGRNHYNSNVPFRAGDWKCEVCMYHNFAKNLCCLKCGVAKPIMSHQQANPMHSVNTTAAAIAAATASGQPLNLNSNAFIGLQQSQMQHHYNQQRGNNNNNNISGGHNYNNNNNSNSSNNQKNQYYNSTSLRSGLSQQSSVMTQQALMYSQQQQQQQQQGGMGPNNSGSLQQKYSGSQNSPNLYSMYSNSGHKSVGNYSNNEPITGPVVLKNSNHQSPGMNGQSFNSLNNQMNSLNLN
ncbi:conserved hypothetical protein [Candida tropicalis MYA-3404]|uniref:Asparagine-rich protein n=1 Tax=Candida tropicalis (strain ATCC MYA-3404 / T1) TaxID=294747 RepID=C5MCP5_CANTT|nr:conserved hypothetical protein [Candida tropicalis MYA-3404]EER32325.1 conserved hypothetical protein [Candida tropicalis MYA-3404]KAG4405931.1 hypothetical protein JTP64_004802 [Candida tropicalis]